MILPTEMPFGGGAGAAVTAFAASLVEFIEALSVVLAVGAARGWRPALAGAAGAALVLAMLLAALGPLAGPPPAGLRLAVGVLSLLFGLRWLRKAVLRAGGRIPLHDEQVSYDRAYARLARGGVGAGTLMAAAAAFQVVMIEGLEVAFIVAAIGAGSGTLGAAAVGAAGALLVVALLGLLLHRPITRVPENTLKLVVGVMMTAFGLASIAEALGAPFPGGDAALPVLAVIWAGFAYALARLLAMQRRTAV
jgi:uncharacterized membrane protein